MNELDAPKKDPFKKLNPELRKSMENMSDEELRKKVSEVALYRQTRVDVMKADPEIQRLSQDLALEKKDYNDEIKGADLQIKFAKSLLEGRGKL